MIQHVLQRWNALGIRTDHAVFAGVIVVGIGLLIVLQKRAYRQGETAAENRIMRGIIGEHLEGNPDIAVARDPGYHGL